VPGGGIKGWGKPVVVEMGRVKSECEMAADWPRN